MYARPRRHWVFPLKREKTLNDVLRNVLLRFVGSTATFPSAKEISVETTTAAPQTVTRDTARTTLFSALTGLAALAVLLQGLWAGVFLEHDGQRDDAGSWIDVHARG